MTVTSCHNCTSVELIILRSMKLYMNAGTFASKFDGITDLTFVGKTVDENIPHLPIYTNASDNRIARENKFYVPDKVTALGGVFMVTIGVTMILFVYIIRQNLKLPLKESFLRSFSISTFGSYGNEVSFVDEKEHANEKSNEKEDISEKSPSAAIRPCDEILPDGNSDEVEVSISW